MSQIVSLTPVKQQFSCLKSVFAILSLMYRAVHTTSFLSDGFRVVSGSDDLSCRVWDVASAVELSSFTEHTDYIRAAAPSKLNPDLFFTGYYF